MSFSARVDAFAVAVANLIKGRQPLSTVLTDLASRTIGAGSSTSILDRAAGDARYAAVGGGGGGSSDPLELATDYTTTTPATPATGVVIFSRRRAGRSRPAFVSPSGLETSLQSFMASNKIRIWSASGNSTTAFTQNLTAIVQGTASAINVSVTNLFQSVSRIRYSTLAQASSAAGLRHNLPQFFRGDGSTGPGGFEIIQRFGISVFQSGMRAFCGAYGSGSGIAGTVTSAAGLLNAVGVGFDSGDAYWSIIHNDGAGAATKISLGADFPATTSSEDLYEVRVFTPPRGTSFWVSLTNLTTGVTAQSEITTNIPIASILFGEQLWISTGAGATIAAIDIVSRYVETDY